MHAEKLLHVLVEHQELRSQLLGRWVKLDCYLPRHVEQPEKMSLLLINDGQDMKKLRLAEMLNAFFEKHEIRPVFCVGIHCGPERKMEYGTAAQPDYMGRGAIAGQYRDFVLQELLPYLRIKYHVAHFHEMAFAGFSLGGLSALDIVWHNAHYFSKVGVFSGSLWWRQKAYEDGYEDDKDRIMHNLIRKGHRSPKLKFFFQCGLMDETADRNNNGIIDSVEDTLDLIGELKAKGYPDDHMNYLEMEDGRHDVETWSRAMPYFLKWGWSR